MLTHAARTSGGRARRARRALMVRVRLGLRASPNQLLTHSARAKGSVKCYHGHARMARRAQHIRCSLRSERSERVDNKLDKGLWLEQGLGRVRFGPFKHTGNTRDRSGNVW